MGQLEHITIILLSCIGFCIALYIHLTRRKNSTVLCPRNGNCVKVVNSTYSKILGIHIEFFGMAYYLLTGIFHTIVLTFPMYLLYVPMWTPYAFSYVAIVACVFSLYLLFIQAFKLRDWCIWCVGSAIITTSIFILQLF
jgi:uncharacterized membrane protein